MLGGNPRADRLGRRGRLGSCGIELGGELASAIVRSGTVFLLSLRPCALCARAEPSIDGAIGVKLRRAFLAASPRAGLTGGGAGPPGPLT